MFQEEYKEILKKMFVDSKEYEFESEDEAIRFVDKVLSEAQDQYSSEGYYHKYEELKDFLYSHKVDSIAYFIYEEDYGEY